MSADHRAPRAFCVSSTGGGGGKTLLTLALCAVYASRGLLVQPFKKGPDYIDAAWLGVASGRAAVNLDPYFLPPDQIRQHFLRALFRIEQPGRQALGILEGNRGLYDGLDAQGSCSTANVARTLNLPVLLCISCEKTTRTLAAILQGLISFESGLTFCGVILNRVGSHRHEHALREIVEQETNLKVLGAVPRLDANPLPERHMGIASTGPQLDEQAQARVERLARLAQAHCDLDAILAHAGTVPSEHARETASPRHTSNAPVIGYVEDQALWFYYPENLAALENAGARLRKLSLCSPAGAEDLAEISGLYLGGGFPEDFAQELSLSPALHRLKHLAAQDLPIYAECGGLMLLCRELVLEGKSWPMANIFPAAVQWRRRPVGLGYVAAQTVEINPYFPQGSHLKGHEFHYSACEWKSPPHCALRLGRGQGVWQDAAGNGYDGLVWKNTWGSYLHIFAPAVPGWACAFVDLARRYQPLNRFQQA